MSIVRLATLVSSVFCYLVCLSSCTITTHSKIPIEFTSNADSVSSELLTLVKCQHVNINGIETKTNSKHSNSELRIEVIEPENLPDRQEAQDELTLKIARLLKSSIKESEKFDTFKVLFVFQSSNGGTTTTRYTGHIWRASEI